LKLIETRNVAVRAFIDTVDSSVNACILL